jgi:GNAT superfamily N-acetyltransferase
MRIPGFESQMASFKLSYAGKDDVDILLAHRQGMWLDIHPDQGKEVKASNRKTRDWIKKQLAKGRLIGVIARTPEGKVAGSGCIWLREEQPRPTSKGFEMPYLMSMYTEKGFRRKGVGKLIVKRAIRWSRDHGYERLVLHASKEGRPLYEKLGFEPSTEMRLRL